MLRLPSFTYLQAKSLADALRMKADAGPDAMFVAGGTDLYPNMKRRHQEPRTVISLMGIAELHRADAAGIGACVTLTDVADRPSDRPPVIANAARLVSTPLLRNMGTLGGNLCLDTRCIYYNQSEWWRAANAHCLKTTGTICHVAPKSRGVCFATFSGGLAPALLTLRAEIDLVSPAGRRTVPLARAKSVPHSMSPLV